MFEESEDGYFYVFYSWGSDGFCCSDHWDDDCADLFRVYGAPSESRVRFREAAA